MKDSEKNLQKRTLAHDLFDLPLRKKSINSKKKGDRGELSAARVLKKWTGIEFNRVPNSGGLRWKSSNKIIGDLVPEEGSGFMFTIEVKNYQHVLIEKEIKQRSKIFTFWRQALSDSVRANKEPMLMVRYNDMPKDEFYVFFSNKVSFKAGLDKIAVSYGYYREPKTGNMEGIQGVMMSELSKLSYNDLFTK